MTKTKPLIPRIPPLTPDGCYSKPELYHFFNQCQKRRISNQLMAEALNVPVDRIVYATGIGFKWMFRDELEALSA